jgi:hypothetical protein
LANAACFNCMSPGQLKLAMVQLLCEILSSGGGGGGGGLQYVFANNYAGGTPTDTPIASAAIGFDTSNGTQWNWYNSAWH